MAPHHLPWGFVSPGVVVSRATNFCSFLTLPTLRCRVLTECLCRRTTWVYPSLSFHSLHTHWVYSYSSSNTPSTYQACPSTCSIDSHLFRSIQAIPCIHRFAHTSTKYKTNVLGSPASYIAGPLVREWCRHCPSSVTCVIPLVCASNYIAIQTTNAKRYKGSVHYTSLH